MEDPAFLAPFQPGQRAFVVADASQVAIGAVLMQFADGQPRIVGLFSKMLQPAQARWKIFDLEAWAAVEALRRWEHD